MKKIIYLLILVIGFSGCSVESYDSNEDLITADANLQNDESVSFSPKEACAGELNDYCLTFPQAYSGSMTKKTNVLIDLKVIGNDPTTEESEDYYYIELLREKGDTRACFQYTFEEGIYEIRYKTVGAQGTHWINDTIIVDSCTECTNELTAELTCDATKVLNITFTAEEAGPIVIQGGLTNDTEIQSKQSSILTENTTHSSVRNSNANVTRWEGEVEACQEVNILIEFKYGNGIGDWSAKRGEEVLGTTLEQSCED